MGLGGGRLFAGHNLSTLLYLQNQEKSVAPHLSDEEREGDGDHHEEGLRGVDPDQQDRAGEVGHGWGGWKGGKKEERREN